MARPLKYHLLVVFIWPDNNIMDDSFSILYLRSKDAVKKGDMSSDCTFDLGSKQITRKQKFFKISLISFVCPYSWTNINSRRNILRYT